MDPLEFINSCLVQTGIALLNGYESATAAMPVIEQRIIHVK